MNKVCLHCFVEGRVQGVFFRDTARRKAKELGVTGWVHNMSDGRVEILMCGDTEPVEALREWLWDGPPKAEVIDVVVEERPFEIHADFEVR